MRLESAGRRRLTDHDWVNAGVPKVQLNGSGGLAIILDNQDCPAIGHGHLCVASLFQAVGLAKRLLLKAYTIADERSSGDGR